MKKYLLPLVLFASSISAQPVATYGVCKEQSGRHKELRVEETSIEVNGRTSKVYHLVPSDGSKYLKMRIGDCFDLTVDNAASKPTSIHWHGLVLPVLEDGVAYVTQPPILPGKSQLYNFEIVQSGTYFAHSHYGLEEQKLMAIPLILLPREKQKERDIVLYFEDFSFQSPKEIWQELRKDYIHSRKIHGRGWKPDLMPALSKHSPPHLNDVKYNAYLTNRKTLKRPDIEHVQIGETLRLRFINAACASNFHIDIGSLKGQVVAVDGNDIEPVYLGNFPLAVAQRIDVIVTIPESGGEFPILAQGEGTDMVTGMILTTNKKHPKPIAEKSRTSIGAISNSVETDFHAKYPLKKKSVDRKLTATLEGNMKEFIWAINEHVWPDNKPLVVKEGERVELSIKNKTGMSHPMHLHGHIFQIVEIDGTPLQGALRDTLLVMPGQTVKVQFDANNPGIWAFHCHILYHMWGGMFTTLLYEGYTPPKFTPKQIKDYSRIYGGY